MSYSNLGLHPSAAPPQSGNPGGHSTFIGGGEDIARQMYGAIDSTPRVVGGIVLGALLTLVGLKALGFRFAVGVKVGK